MDYIINHQAETWLLLGFIALIIEVVTGFSTGIFLFAGLAALTTGALMNFGLLAQTAIAGISCTGICTGLISLILWKPLKKLQDDHPVTKDNSSDLVGHEFILDTGISHNNPGSRQFSGILWKVELDKQCPQDSIAAGQTVVISSVEVGRFIVKPTLTQ